MDRLEDKKLAWARSPSFHFNKVMTTVAAQLLFYGNRLMTLHHLNSRAASALTLLRIKESNKLRMEVLIASACPQTNLPISIHLFISFIAIDGFRQGLETKRFRDSRGADDATYKSWRELWLYLPTSFIMRR